jgi:hypothetical protein
MRFLPTRPSPGARRKIHAPRGAGKGMHPARIFAGVIFFQSQAVIFFSRTQ